MAVDVTLNTITSGYNVSKINTNFTAIDTALQDALSRSGTSPNQMNADFDMNSNDILNVGELEATTLTLNGAPVTPSTLTTIADYAVNWDQLHPYIAYFVPPTMFGADLSGSVGDRALVKLAWQFAVANGLPFAIPVFADGKPLEIQVTEDFATVQAAHDATLNWLFPGAIPKLADTSPIPLNSYPQFALRISMTGAAEQVYSGKGLVWNHPFGDKIELYGRDTVGLTLASFQASTFSSGVHLTRIRFSTWPSTAPRVGASMRILFPTGVGTDVDQLDGIWRITAVDSTNKDITLAVYSHEMASNLTITSLSGGIYVYVPSGIRGINQPPNGAQNGLIDIHTVLHARNFYVSGDDSGTNDPETNNIVLRYGARLDCAGYGGALEGTRTCLWALAGSMAQLDNWAFCGGESYGISAIQAVIDGQNCSASGNLLTNIVAQLGAVVSLVVGNFGGSGGVGIDATGGAKVLIGGKINKCNIGVQTRADARIDVVADAEIKNSTTTPGQRIGLGGKIYLDSTTNVTGTFIPPQNLSDSSGGGITTTNKASSPGTFKGNAAWNPASIANGAQASTTVAVTDVTVGMRAEAWANITLSGLRLWAEVTAANTVTTYLSNNTGGAVDLGLFTVYVKVVPAET